MRASFNDKHRCGIGIHKGINIFQKKKNYCDVVELGTSLNLKTESYKKDSNTRRVTLTWWKVHLDSCTTYHTSFVEYMLTNIHQVKTALGGSCNAGVTTSTTKVLGTKIQGGILIRMGNTRTD